MNEEVALIVNNEYQIRHWESYTIDDDFLTPCAAWNVVVGAGADWKNLSKYFVPEMPFHIDINGVRQVDGWIDSVTVSGPGTTVTIKGRDMLMPLVKSNVHPDTKVKDRTVEQLVSDVMVQVYGEMPVVQFDNEANRKLITNAKKGYKGKTHSIQEKIEYAQPHVNEGAFEFLARNLRRFGLWMWAGANNTVVVSSPNYTQTATYVLTRKTGAQHVQYSGDPTYTLDMSDVVSYIQVRGKSTAKAFEKKTVMGSVAREDAPFGTLMYIVNDQAETNEQAYNFAKQELSRSLQNSRVYEATMAGHTDPITKHLYAVDTIVRIQDEFYGIDEDMWIAKRTFNKSATGGTTTQIKCLPKHAIQFSDVDAP